MASTPGVSLPARLESGRRWPVASLTLAAAALALHVAPGLATAFEFDRVAIAGGQLWRFVTGSWAHWSGEHVFWDGLTFAVLGALCERRSRAGYLWCVAITALLVGAAVWWLTDCQWYRGLSGHSMALGVLLGALTARECISRGDWRGVALLSSMALLAVAKVVYEVITGGAIFVDQTAMRVVPHVHVVGALVGAITALSITLRTSSQANHPVPGCACEPCRTLPRSGDAPA